MAAPMSPQCQEVSCYIDYNVSMSAQNLWKVVILNREQNGDVWHTIQSQVRLIHVDSNQALKFSGRQLPDWGFHQHEVVADRVVNQDDTVWNVEEHRYTKCTYNCFLLIQKYVFPAVRNICTVIHQYNNSLPYVACYIQGGKVSGKEK